MPAVDGCSSDKVGLFFCYSPATAAKVYSSAALFGPNASSTAAASAVWSFYWSRVMKEVRMELRRELRAFAFGFLGLVSLGRRTDSG